ncbi:glycoside hydrolase family 20 zincin-like fold domain-containing protein, partial [Acidobacteria bacterium AH-259-O06]|nr:glycoside hydrolase family 20 zincin-like fold domain-containing protein [Acidobacteria bacterium AH-259-O06]
MLRRLCFRTPVAIGFLLGGACQQPDMDTASLPYVIPDPRSMVVVGAPVAIPEGPGSVVILLPEGPSLKVQLAADLVRERLAELTGRTDLVSTTEAAGAAESAALKIHLLLWQGEEATQPMLENLDSGDLDVLRDPEETEQSYLIRVADRDVVLVGPTDQGVLYAATTLIQLLDSSEGRLELAKVHVRDFPDIKYRVAADWLQNVESNRWGYDYGDGRDNFIRRIKRKLDFCLKYKINAVQFDGFGWTMEPKYADLMRSLNQYARQRGIHLFFGGYGSGYGLGTYQGFFNSPAYRGRLFYNRRSYPDGEIYSCIGIARQNERFPPRTLGTCRSNEELNQLKQEELAAFVQAVEPGALYIHHEDLGLYSRTQTEWELRDEGCRKRWPNDDLKAMDGGAGGLAHGYNSLLDAIYSVKNEETGYNASRDCIIVLISPVYMAFGVGKTPYHHDSIEAARQDWNNVRELWVNIFRQLKYQGPRIQGGFREMFPFEGPGQTWPLALNQRLREEDLDFGIYVFVVEGANYYNSDSTFTAAPIGNSSFAGATTF